MVEARRINHKSNWLDLMNNSADGPTLQERFNKANINIDRTTLKLLPILLKALKQNRYVDKIIEEPTSLYPPYERSDTTDVAYTKNIFADTRNWMKMPNSRLYTIEYKTSPIVYFKNPTRNVDYFTKIRKIRDYQRIMNYVDKMISDKNLLGSTQPMKSDLGYTEIPIIMTKPMTKYKTTQKMVNKQTTTPKVSVQEKKSNCKCPHKVGKLMQKVLNSIQHLLSYFSVSNGNKTVSGCSDSIQTEPLQTLDDIPSQERHVVTKNHEVIEPEITKTTSYKNFLNKHKYTLDITPTNNIDRRRDYTIKTIMSLLKPNFNKHNNFDTNLDPNYGFSTTNSYVGLSDTNSLTKETGTESILKYLNYANRKIPMDAVTTVADYILQKGVYDISPETKSSDSTLADTDFTTDDDYYTETTVNLSNNFDKLDVHSLELVKNKIVRKNDTNEEKSRKIPFKGTRPSQNVYNNISSMRKVGNLASSDKNNTKPLSTLHRFAPITKPILKSTTTKKSTPLVSTTKPTAKTTKSQTKFRYFNTKPTTTKNTEHKDVQFKKNHTDKIELGDDDIKAWQEIISKETTLKYIEEEIKKLNNETTTDQADVLTNTDSQWELVQLEENSTSIKSMIPLSRPTYLEMQRNDWKHNEVHDYDTNIVLLIYEYMIVVETSIVQNRRILKRNNKTVAHNDHPIADRLDRSYFGFDQDYYERMPLLVNALQENGYMDPSTEIFENPHKKRHFPDVRNIRLTTENYRAIRRTSPRPFLYEYKNPIPAPFSKSNTKEYASRSWIESYRNAQRLKNLNEIIKYLERTLNAKFGDMKTQTSTRIAFSGIYMEPFADEHKETDEENMSAHSSNRHEFRSNHQFDPLYTFKPDHPGEINLLAEGLRFGPASSMHFISEIVPTVPLFRPITNRKRNCFGDSCNDEKIEFKNVKLSSTSSTEDTSLNNLKSFGVMLNLYPLHSMKSTDTTSSTVSTPTELDKIYLTTSRPKIQFKRKSSFPVRRTSVGGRPRFSSRIRQGKNHMSRTQDSPKSHDIESTTMPKMIVHVNVYSVKKEIEKAENVSEMLMSNTQTDFTTSTTTSTFTPIINDYRVLNTSHVEDFHVGSSGIIPIEERITTIPPPILPVVTPIVPLYDTTVLNYEAPRTDPPDVIRFSPEDARIPDQYLNIRKTDGRQVEVTEITPNIEETVENEEDNIEARTLVVKLKKYETSKEEKMESTEDYEEVAQTYVPQINGHYRNLIHKSLSTLLRENSEKYRIKLENSIPSIRKSTYVPMYVEIKRNYTRSQIDDND